MAARGDRLAFDVDVDVVPVREFGGDDRGGGRVVGLQVFDRLVGEDDAPAKRHPRRIALEDGDVVCWIAQLHRDGEIEARRAAADAGDLHRRNSLEFTNVTLCVTFFREDSRSRHLK